VHHHADAHPATFLVDDLKTVANSLRERLSALFRRVTVQHVSGQWVEQHERDAAKH
jgi:hypothetical protein